MELKDFIKGALVQVVTGIEEAGKELGQSTALINPQHTLTNGGRLMYHAESLGSNGTPVQEMEFDVAVFAKEGAEAKSGFGILVGSVGIGAHGKLNEASGSESRIKFKIPIVLPVSTK